MCVCDQTEAGKKEEEGEKTRGKIEKEEEDKKKKVEWRVWLGKHSIFLF